MPRGDGTGPRSVGPGSGGGMGRRSSGRGQSGGKDAGPGGYCICPRCGERQPHQLGTACFEVKCPKCDAVMTRE